MKSFPLSDLSRNTAAVRHEAARGPVAITERNTPRFVLMAIEDFERLAGRREDSRRAYRLADMPADDAAMLIAGLAPHILEGDRSGDSRNPRL
jgi:prevent-host-death family protein